MSRRYLFGPVSAAGAASNLAGPRRAGDCLCFNSAGDADLSVREGDTWDDVAARFPAGWQPDFLALWLGQGHVPACLWSAPVPVIGLVGEWDWRCHFLRQAAR